ncbi:AMP-binding protein [Massilia sp. DWR3-1-1]|uniref:AMP-binding protein n=1 Tax=Massilia sp. DWR3-1-1 TaxID=2804559 RepID=UPI003CF9B2AA
MDKIWLKSYPAGVPADIDPARFDSLVDMLDWICGRYAGLPAFSNQGATLSWGRLDALSRHFAAYLQHTLGLRKGERVALMMPNLLQYPVALFGALRAGAVVVNVNPQYTARELQHQLADAGARVIVVLDHFAHTLEQIQSLTAVRQVVITRLGDMLHFPRAQIVNLLVKHVRHMVPAWHIGGAVSFADALRLGEAQAPVGPAPGPADIAFLQYTGGTTGVPKGAILSHRNLVANIEQTAAWVTGVLVEGAETAIIPLPLYHVFALTATLTFCRLGAHIVLITDPRNTPTLLSEMKHTPFSVMIGVNTLFNTILEAPEARQFRPAGVKLVVAGGMALQRAVAERWRASFGVPLTEGYGLTETSPIVCANVLNVDHFTGSIGLPLPSTEVAIMDEDGRMLAPGERGEICVRGPQVMQGYWHMDDETAHVFHGDSGWLRTGDIGVMDAQGFVKLIDRQKDIIVVSGFKVYPNEVEEVVSLHPGVAEVAAIRAADEHSEEVVKIVVRRRDADLSAEALIDYCRKTLTAYKVPRYVVFRDAPLPKSNIGKILRRVVMAEEAGAGAGAPTGRPSGAIHNQGST